MKGLLSSLQFWWIVAGALAVLAVLGFCHKPAHSAITPKEQAELTALRDTRARDSLVIDSLKQTSRNAVSRAETQQTKSTAARQSADRSQATADKLAITARQAQTADARAVEWKAAFDARTMEADSLRHALAYSDSANVERERARQAIASALALSESRRQKAEALNESLAKTITTAGQCKVLFIPCVSRPVAFVTGAVIGAAGGIYLARR